MHLINGKEIIKNYHKFQELRNRYFQIDNEIGKLNRNKYIEIENITKDNQVKIEELEKHLTINKIKEIDNKINKLNIYATDLIRNRYMEALKRTKDNIKQYEEELKKLSSIDNIVEDNKIMNKINELKEINSEKIKEFNLRYDTSKDGKLLENLGNNKHNISEEMAKLNIDINTTENFITTNNLNMNLNDQKIFDTIIDNYREICLNFDIFYTYAESKNDINFINILMNLVVMNNLFDIEEYFKMVNLAPKYKTYILTLKENINTYNIEDIGNMIIDYLK